MPARPCRQTSRRVTEADVFRHIHRPAAICDRDCRRYYVGRLDCHQVDPDRAIPRHRAAAGDSDGELSRRRSGGDREHGGAADRAANQRRRQCALLSVGQRLRRQLYPHRDLRAGHRPRHQYGQRAEPRPVWRYRSFRSRFHAPASRSARNRRPCCRSSISTRQRIPSTPSISATMRPSMSSTPWRKSRASGRWFCSDRSTIHCASGSIRIA